MPAALRVPVSKVSVSICYPPRNDRCRRARARGIRDIETLVVSPWQGCCLGMFEEIRLLVIISQRGALRRRKKESHLVSDLEATC